MNDSAPINTLAGRDHNRPPLAELLAEELDGDKARADQLLEAAAAAKITTQGEAEKVADLIALIRAEEKAVDKFREERRRPAQDEVRTIDAACGAIVGPLARARVDLKTMLDAWLAEHGGAALRPSVASVGGRREIEFVITDLPAAIGWLVTNRAGEICQAARTIIGKHLRSLGVEHAEEANIPGVSVKVETRAQVR